MRVKTFTEATISGAMERMRRELGDDAIIISTREQPTGAATVLAAVETEADPVGIDEPDVPDASTMGEALRHALAFHGCPPRLTTRLVDRASRQASPDPTVALAAALDEHLAFSSLGDTMPRKPVMLVGPPGSGKTVTVAKLCARKRLNGATVRAVSTDGRRAGGIEQLVAFTRILEIDLARADTPSELASALAATGDEAACFIDTAGANPYSQSDMDVLFNLVDCSDLKPVLVFPAGLDPSEAAEMARTFGDLGVKRMIVTKIDMARRTGGILAAADAARLAFAEISINLQVAEGLTPLNPMAFARLITPHSQKPETAPDKAEAAS